MPDQHTVDRLSILIVALALISGCATTSTVDPDAAIGVDAELGTLVTAQWLSEHLNDPDLVVLDCTVRVEMDEKGFRSVSALADYEGGHIPTAGFADLTGDLSDGDNRFEFAAPSPEQFAAVMGALGVGDDTRVVLYDSYNSVWAARVWWMLRWVGFDRVALLDGGLRAWTEAGLPLSTEPANRPARQLTAAVRPELIADRDEVFAAIDNSAVRVIDVLPEAHYRGEMVMYDRPGHIPGASNLPSSSLLDESGLFRSFEELDMMHDGDRNTRAITYCGGGIAAAANAFIMNRLGFTDVAIYDNSLQEWAADPVNPMAVGP